MELMKSISKIHDSEYIRQFCRDLISNMQKICCLIFMSFLVLMSFLLIERNAYASSHTPIEKDIASFKSQVEKAHPLPMAPEQRALTTTPHAQYHNDGYYKEQFNALTHAKY
jgi:hypothetical protein